MAILYVFLGTVVLLAIAVLLTRLRAVAREPEEAPAPPAPAPAPAEENDSLAGVTDALLVSPLTIILGQCELARGLGQLDERLEIIERQARRIADLVHRNPAPLREMRQREREIGPAEFARAAVDTHAGRALERGVKVHVLLDEAPAVRANPFLLSHALRHLVHAAIEGAPQGAGDVTLAVGVMPPEGEPTHVAFAVADDGPGLEPAHLARILEPRTEEPLEKSELAYSIVYAISKAMHAGFVLDTAPGAGTRATLKVPLTRVAKPVLEDAPQETTELANA